ncbi:hypothetical protein Tco_1147959 [Tanacetum coccineum]
MDPNTSIGRLCLGENNQGSVAEGLKDIENKGTSEGPEESKNSSSGEGTKLKGPLLSIRWKKKEFAVKLCLEYEEKIRVKLVKRELLVSLKGEFYFVKFIVNPEEDDVEPNVILGRSTSFSWKLHRRCPGRDWLLIYVKDFSYLRKKDIWMVKLRKKEEEAIKQVKGEALQEKEDPGAFIIPI